MVTGGGITKLAMMPMLVLAFLVTQLLIDMVALILMAIHILTQLPIGVQSHQLDTVKQMGCRLTPLNGVIEMVMATETIKTVTIPMNVLTNPVHLLSIGLDVLIPMVMAIPTKETPSLMIILNGQTGTVIPKIVEEITNLETTQIYSQMTLLSVKTLMAMDTGIMPQEITAMRSSLTQHNGLILMVMDTAIITELGH